MFYLTTTVLSWVLMGISSKAIYSRLKEEGYEFIPKKKTTDEERLEKTKAILFMLLPVVNILFSGFLTFAFDKAYEIVKNTWIKEGKAVLKEEKEEPKEEVEIDLNSKDMNQTRKYSELSNEEKLRILEEEKANLLREKESTTSQSDNSRGAYTKRRDNK